MSGAKKLILLLLLGVLVLAALAGATAALTVALFEPWLHSQALRGTTITLNDHTWRWPDLSHLTTTQVALGAALAVLAVLVAVPLALVLALGGTLLGLLAGGVALVVGLALALSPLLVVVAVLWWLMRPRPAADPGSAPAQPTGTSRNVPPG